MIYFILMLLAGVSFAGGPLEAEKLSLVRHIAGFNARSPLQIRIPYQPWNMPDEAYIRLLVEHLLDLSHHLRNFAELAERREAGLPLVNINRQPTPLMTLEELERILATQRDTSNRIEEIE